MCALMSIRPPFFLPNLLLKSACTLQASRAVSMSRAIKELRGLMPFSWDSRVEEHPVGSAAMRDFQDAFGWSERNPRTPGASSTRKRSTPVGAFRTWTGRHSRV